MLRWIWLVLAGMEWLCSCWDSFCVIVGIWGVCSTNVEMHFGSSLACSGTFRTSLNTFEQLGQHDLICILSPRWYERGLVKTCDTFCVIVYIQTTHVEMQFLSSLIRDGFGKHMLRCIMCPRWHGKVFVNACWQAFCGLDGNGGLVNTFWIAFCVLSGMGWVSSSHVEIHFVSLLAWNEFDAFLVIGGMNWVWSMQVEIYFVSTLGLDDSCWEASYVLAGMVEMQFMFSLLWIRFCKHKMVGISFACWNEGGLVNAFW